MRNLNRIELDRLCYWILAICFSTILILSTSAIVTGLAKGIVDLIRGHSNQVYVRCDVNGIKHDSMKLVCQSKLMKADGKGSSYALTS